MQMEHERMKLESLRRAATASRLVAPTDAIPEHLDSPLSELMASGLRDIRFEQLASQLRKLRRNVFRRIVIEALGAGTELDNTLRALSDFADWSCAQTLERVWHELAARFGQPIDPAIGARASCVVLGMGKLGGRELNFSSDIDLIFLHSADGMTDGAEPIDNERFFVKLVQQVGRLLSEQTADGFVFRVDTMLRPFGSAGPMCMSIDAAEEYYQKHGREWERYAMIKARPIAGDLALGEEFLRRIQPFVYRRYLDYNAIISLRDLKRRIHDDVVARKIQDDVKLGPGGIRELEFIVQSFQLVRGGQDAMLRNTSLRPTLAYLGQADLVPRASAEKLDDSYVFLRKLENAIQMYDDQQTHRLPTDEDARRALCVGLGYADWNALIERYAQVTTYVHEEFQRVFAEREHEDENGPCSAVVRLAFAREAKADDISEQLHACGFATGEVHLAQHLVDLARSHLVQGLSDAAELRLQHMLGLLLETCCDTQYPSRSAESVLKVIDAIAGRTTYLTLLDESPVVRAHLVKLCAASRWVTEQIAASPAVLDALLDPRSLYAPPDRASMVQDLDALLAQVPIDDVETGMDVLRRYRNEITVRIAAAEISGSLALVKVSDHLTWLAEAVLDASIARATQELETSCGRVLCDDGSVAQMSAIAFGKFGGIELGYSSDLDIVFVYDNVAHDADSQGGPRKLPAPAWVHAACTTHRASPGHADTRRTRVRG